MSNSNFSIMNNNLTKKEEDLLAEACQWFKNKYGKSPQELGWEFIKIWYKPSPLFKKRPTVVFAQTEEEGKTLIWEQNVLWRIPNYIWIFPIYAIAFFFALFSRETRESAITIGILFSIPGLLALLLVLYLGRKCQKFEKIHQWKPVIYYP